MSEDQLFDYDVKPKRAARATNSDQELVARPPGYLLITNRSGVQGFHRTTIPDPSYAEHGSRRTLCGITGRVISEFPKKIPLCAKCEAEYEKRGET